MKVAITGSSGFIGSHLSERLEVLGHEAVPLWRYLFTQDSPDCLVQSLAGWFRRGQSGGRSPGPPLDGCLQAGADGQPDHDHAQAGGGSESSARTTGSDDFHVCRGVLQSGRLPRRARRSGGGLFSGGVVRGLGSGGGTRERSRGAWSARGLAWCFPRTAARFPR